MTYQIKRDSTTHRMLSYGPNVGVAGPGEEVLVVQDDSTMALLQGVASATINNDGSFTTVPLTLPFIKEDAPFVPDFSIVTHDATPVVLARFSIPTQTLYVANFKLRGIDTANGNRRYIDATYMVARVNGAAVIDSNVINFNGFNNATAQAWIITASIDPNSAGQADFVIQVTGQAARDIEWVLKTTVHRFRPQGLAPGA